MSFLGRGGTKMYVEYVDDGVLFCGHFVPWGAGKDDVVQVAGAVAQANRYRPETIERILASELRLAPARSIA